MAGWTTLRELIELEITQKMEEGAELVEKEWRQKLAGIDPQDQAKLQNLYAELQALEVPAECSFLEPYELDAIREQAPDAVDLGNEPIGEKEFFDKLHGGWIGRCCGCSLGRPFETPPYTKHPEDRQRDSIQAWLKGANAWPLKNYVPCESAAEMRGLNVVARDSTREAIRAQEADSNIDFLLVALYVLENYGLDFQTGRVAQTWARLLTFNQLPAAETQAFINTITHENFSRTLPFFDGPGQINWEDIASRQNPFRESVNGRSRADVYGFLLPGDVVRAAELAWRDARLSHTKNGLYAAMFTAALIAASFRTREPRLLLQAALSQIPKDCRLAHAVGQMVKMRDKYLDWADCWDEMQIEYAGIDHRHAIPNTLILVMALLYGESNFETVLTTTVCSGLCPASNGATAGAIMGVQYGGRGIPSKWVRPLANTMKSHVKGHESGTISDGAGRCLAIYRKGIY